MFFFLIIDQNLIDELVVIEQESLILGFDGAIFFFKLGDELISLVRRSEDAGLVCCSFEGVDALVDDCFRLLKDFLEVLGPLGHNPQDGGVLDSETSTLDLFLGEILHIRRNFLPYCVGLTPGCLRALFSPVHQVLKR